MLLSNILRGCNLKTFIFIFDDYKVYLNAFIKELPKEGYGFKSRIAEAIGCKTAYVAQVLNGHAHFSPEQAESLNPVLHHSEIEADFFLLLVQLARAGTQNLRRRIESQMEVLRAKQLNLKQRFRAGHDLGEKEVIEFFSRWYIAAVHLGATIPRLKTRRTLALALGVDKELIDEALQFLIMNGLLQEQKGNLEPGPTRIFIGKDSPIMKLHHANWRAKAVQSLDVTKSRDVHFTSVYSLSTKDAAIIRERLIREIEAVRGIVRESPEEELHTLTLDFFRVDG